MKTVLTANYLRDERDNEALASDRGQGVDFMCSYNKVRKRQKL